MSRIGAPLLAGALFGRLGPGAPFLAFGVLMLGTAAWTLRVPVTPIFEGEAEAPAR